MHELNSHVHCFKSQAEPHQSSLVLGGTGPNGAAHISTISALSLDYIEQLQSVHVISGSVFSLMSCLAHREGALNRDNFENYDQEVRNIHQASMTNVVKHFVRKRKNPRTLFDNERIRDTVEMLFGRDFVQTPLSALSYSYCFHAYCSNKGEVIELSAKTFPDMTLAEVAMATASVPFMHGEFSYQGMSLSDPIFCPLIRPFRKRMFSLPGYKLYVNHKRSGLSGKVYFIKTEERRFPEFSMSCDFLTFNLGFSNRYVNNLHRRLIKEILIDG
ncbi:hypothetical protein MARGE09_P0414 [Marinagarivorans cellulosilyticus]|uniref:PNPLA domain-containing protein n=2 Tax=Marinagarivorans cellulosilyticus TaxID=2721545 RepID=A0AAN1WES2_9GAMM|nr:hypothetical protein MARGE09_P0414 [Marinagarivorans cellulosilyticus]